MVQIAEWYGLIQDGAGSAEWHGRYGILGNEGEGMVRNGVEWCWMMLKGVQKEDVEEDWKRKQW